jgi:hypothetical protein
MSLQGSAHLTFFDCCRGGNKIFVARFAKLYGSGAADTTLSKMAIPLSDLPFGLCNILQIGSYAVRPARKTRSAISLDKETSALREGGTQSPCDI